MFKVIKEFNNEDLVYQLGYDLYNNKVYPRIDIYKNRKKFSGCGRAYGTVEEFFYFRSINDAGSYINTTKELFMELRQDGVITEEVEKEFESLFLLYKLNDFKRLGKD